MEPEKNTTPDAEEPKEEEQQAPADALSRTPEDLEQEETEKAASGDKAETEQPADKKISPIKRFFRKVNLYLLIFALIVVIAAIITVVSYLNSQKTPPAPTVSSQTLTTDALKQLANNDATVGSTSQTLTIQGNAVISGQTLARGSLNVAGNFATGGSITAPSLTVSGKSNFSDTQISSLQVAQNTAIQGTTTLRDLNVSGTSSFSGPLTASQITVTDLIMSGNASLRVPNHISFPGASPGRSVGNALGAGGSVSVNGSDTTGTINVNTGGSPSAGCFVTVNFHQTFTNNPHVIVTPVGKDAGSLQYYVNRDKTSFSICTNTAATGGKVFAFDYFVTN